jgi:hypothetical protein
VTEARRLLVYNTARRGSNIDAIEQRARLAGVQLIVLPVLTTCFGPRTACAGLVVTTWPVSNQSNSMPDRRQMLLAVGVSKLCPNLAGTFREQRIVLNTLRYISNELKISLVCFGVNEAREAISGDVQLACRFEEFPPTRWSADEEFEDLVLAIVRNLPLIQRCFPHGRCAACCRSPTASRRRCSTFSMSSRLKRSRTEPKG